MLAGQVAFLCGCGASHILARGMCPTCYWAHMRDEKYFGGQRQRALRRDRQCLVCGCDKRLIVHHRRPGVNDARFFATLCRRHHVMIHRRRTPPFGISAFCRKLWRELRPGVPEQLELPFSRCVLEIVIPLQQPLFGLAPNPPAARAATA